MSDSSNRYLSIRPRWHSRPGWYITTDELADWLAENKDPVETATEEVRIIASVELLESMAGGWSPPVQVTAIPGLRWEMTFRSDHRLDDLRAWLDTYPPLSDDVTGDPELIVVAKVRAILDGES